MKIEFNNLYTHFVIVTQNRLSLIKEIHRPRIEKFITGVVNNYNSKLYAIYANPEHAHLLISRAPEISEESLITKIADSSAKFINENEFCVGRFCWQDSAAAFSVSKSDIDKVCKYILNQPHHHKNKSFAQEYDEFIRFYQKTLILVTVKHSKINLITLLFRGKAISACFSIRLYQFSLRSW